MGCNIIRTDENIIIGKNPLSFKLNLDMEFEEFIISIKEMSNNRIGILFKHALLIYSSIDFKFIKKVEYEFNFVCCQLDRKYSEFTGFIETKNCDLILWTIKYGLIFKLKGEEYELIEFFEEWTYNLNYFGGFKELTNGNIVYSRRNEPHCPFALQFYSKDKSNDKYNLLSKHFFDISYEDLIEINPNELILLRKHETISFCHVLTVYDVNKEEIKKIIYLDGRGYIGDFDVNYIIKKEYLFIRYAHNLIIFNTKKDMDIVYFCNEKIEKKMELFDMSFNINIKTLKDEMNIRFLCNYIDDLIIVQDEKNVIKLFKFKGGLLKFYKEFPFQNKGLQLNMIRLKNNNFILYQFNELSFLKNI